MPLFGDHRLIMFCINMPKVEIEPTLRRDRRNYPKDLLCNALKTVNWSMVIEDLQGFWNDFEFRIIKIIDELIPMCTFVNNVAKEKVP